MLKDSYLHKGKRNKLVQSLKKKGITDPNVLDAIANIPRHFYIESAFEQHAYEDKPFSIGEGQTISTPYTVAFQSQLLEIKPGDKILEIGTGSGYQTSVLSYLKTSIYSIEYNKNLFQKTKKKLSELKIKKINLFQGDGTLGLIKHAPFDKIIVTAGATNEIPQPLIDQLKTNGILIIPSGNKEKQIMLKVTKTEDNCSIEEYENFSFVPLLGKHGWK